MSPAGPANMTSEHRVAALQAFLRFIPSSRFHAKEGEYPIDLSPASVMARQVMEDAIFIFVFV